MDRVIDKPWLEGKNVLVTGVSGFVGSQLTKDLVVQGANVTGIVKDLNRNHQDILANINLVVGDVTDFDLLRNVISANEIDVIYHFAAYAIVRISARDPMTTYDVNVMGTVALLEAARQVGKCQAIIVASSDKAYGDHSVLPYTEEHPLLPKNTYDTSKACMDMISQSYAHNYGMPITVTRCSNIYGPGDYNFSRIIPNTIRRVLSGQPPALYSDIEKMEREFIFIDDVVAAYEALAPISHSGEAYNIGGTGPVMIRDLATTICGLAGKPDLEPVIIPREPQFKEIQKQYINSSKLFLKTGWHPKVNLTEGLRRSIDWYENFA